MNFHKWIFIGQKSRKCGDISVGNLLSKCFCTFHSDEGFWSNGQQLIVLKFWQSTDFWKRVKTNPEKQWHLENPRYESITRRRMIAMIFRLYCKVIVKSKWIISKQCDLYSYNDERSHRVWTNFSVPLLRSKMRKQHYFYHYCSIVISLLTNDRLTTSFQVLQIQKHKALYLI